eukprot:10768115-Lingulodinium_polyedra.AAC.1
MSSGTVGDAMQKTSGASPPPADAARGERHAEQPARHSRHAEAPARVARELARQGLPVRQAVEHHHERQVEQQHGQVPEEDPP